MKWQTWQPFFPVKLNGWQLYYHCSCWQLLKQPPMGCIMIKSLVQWSIHKMLMKFIVNVSPQRGIVINGLITITSLFWSAIIMSSIPQACYTNSRGRWRLHSWQMSHHDESIWYHVAQQWLNTLRSEQNGCHWAHDIFSCIFLNKNACVMIKISLKFIPKGSIDSKSALVQVMAWYLAGTKPLPELMLTKLHDAWHHVAK